MYMKQVGKGRRKKHLGNVFPRKWILDIHVYKQCQKGKGKYQKYLYIFKAPLATDQL